MCPPPRASIPGTTSRESCTAATRLTASIPSTASSLWHAKSPALLEARVVHQYIDRPVVRLDPGDEIAYLLPVGEIGRVRPAAKMLGQLGDCRLAPRDERDPCPCGCERGRERRADPARGPGDQDPFAV